VVGLLCARSEVDAHGCEGDLEFCELGLACEGSCEGIPVGESEGHQSRQARDDRWYDGEQGDVESSVPTEPVTFDCYPEVLDGFGKLGQ
jgi:hypothetical protein